MHEGESSGDGRNSGGCYGIQVLIAGPQKQWRDCVNLQARRAGFRTTNVDSAKDVLTVLVLGLPVDVLVVDSDLEDQLDEGNLSEAAHALRPNLSIVLVEDVPPFYDGALSDGGRMQHGEGGSWVARKVWSALENRVA